MPTGACVSTNWSISSFDFFWAGGWLERPRGPRGPRGPNWNRRSSDAGRSWKKIDDEPHNFQILDHGGVLVLVPWRKQSNEIKFSLDEGKSISTFSFLGHIDAQGFEGAFTSDFKTLFGSGGDVECESQSVDDVKEVYTCVQGGAMWSPARVEITLSSHKATLSTIALPSVAYTGTWKSGTNTIEWSGKADGKRWATWTKDSAADAQEAAVQIQGVATEPGGKSAVVFAYWCVKRRVSRVTRQASYHRRFPILIIGCLPHY
jgi:hypothetical protein